MLPSLQASTLRVYAESESTLRPTGHQHSLRLSFESFGMGGRLSYPHSCTVQYPWDVGFLLTLCDWVPGYLLLLLAGIGLGATIRTLMGWLCPYVPRTYRRASNLLTRWSRRFSRGHQTWWISPQRLRSPRTPASPSPRAVRSPAVLSPRLGPAQPPSSLAILAPIPNPPAGLVRALEGYQLKPFDESQ